MSILQFFKQIRAEYRTTDAMITELNEIGYQCAQEAHRGADIPKKTLYALGRDFMIDSLHDGSFDLDTMKFI